VMSFSRYRSINAGLCDIPTEPTPDCLAMNGEVRRPI
jgi:hypothetical protein